MKARKSADPLRAHLVKLLSWGDAHVTFEKAVAGLPARLRGIRPKGMPYSAWELLEHMRLAQHDILAFCRPGYTGGLKFPEGYWPATPAPPSAGAFRKCVAAILADRAAMARLAADPKIDLFARIPHGDGQTYLREVLLVADHGAYHLGELVAVRRALGAWK